MYDDELELAMFLQEFYKDIKEELGVGHEEYHLDILIKAITDFSMDRLNGIFYIWENEEEGTRQHIKSEKDFSDFTEIVDGLTNDVLLAKYEEEGYIEMVGLDKESNPIMETTEKGRIHFGMNIPTITGDNT